MLMVLSKRLALNRASPHHTLSLKIDFVSKVRTPRILNKTPHKQVRGLHVCLHVGNRKQPAA